MYKVIDQYNFTYWEGEDIEQCECFYITNKHMYREQGKLLIIRWEE